MPAYQHQELHTTHNPAFFYSLSTDCLQRNHAMLMRYLKNPNQVNKWPAMQLSRQIIEDVLKQRGIEIITKN